MAQEFRAEDLSSQHPHGSSQLFVTPVSGPPVSLHSHGAQTYMQAKHPLTENKYSFYNENKNKKQSKNKKSKQNKKLVSFSAAMMFI